MIFSNLPLSADVFVDANTLVYHFAPDPVLGIPCSDLLIRIKRQEIHGFTSTHVVAEMAHRLMTEEACILFGWPAQGVGNRLKRHPVEVQQLSRYRQALDEIPLIGIQVLPVTGSLVSLAADVSRQFGLLANDALIVTVMRDHGLTFLASHDADFDRVPGLTRYGPV